MTTTKMFDQMFKFTNVFDEIIDTPINQYKNYVNVIKN